MKTMFPLVLDAEQPAADVVEMIGDTKSGARPDVVVVRQRDRLAVVWWIANVTQLLAACAHASNTDTIATAMLVAPFHLGAGTTWDRATVRDISAHSLGDDITARGWLVLLAGQRLVGISPPIQMTPPTSSAPPAMAPHVPPAPPPAMAFPVILPYPYTDPDGNIPSREPPRAPTRGPRAKPPQSATAASADPAAGRGTREGVARGIDMPAAESPAETETLLAMPRVALPERCVPGIDNGVMLEIGLGAPNSPTESGVMAFVTSREERTIDIDVMVEAPDFTCARGWKQTLAVTKADPFTPTIQLHLIPLAPDDMTVRMSIVRVHYSYKGQPAGLVTRRIALGDATLEEGEAITQPAVAALQIAPTATPVDLTIRISRRDASDSARELIWTLIDCAHPIALPNEPITQKVGDRDTASSFASKVTSQVNAADGTVTVDTMMRGIGTLIRRAMPAPVLQVLLDVAAAVGQARLARILLLTDECFIPWELTLLEPAPNAARAPFLGAQFAVSRWIHGEADVPVPPPATLAVSNLAVVLGNYDASSLAALPHAKEESDALQSQAVSTPTRFPHVTSVNASPEALVDLLNGKLPSESGTIAPEMVHFACHGEVLGSGVSKRSVLYMSDGSALSEMLFVASSLGKSTKSFLFMNACQVGVGGDELGQYAGFPGMAIGAGFSGFVGPLWSVNDQIAKGIALDFYKCALGADGSAPRAVADVLADMRSQYASEPDPKKRQSTWLAYVHYGHPHFTFTHA
jgi:hypothetical protein